MKKNKDLEFFKKNGFVKIAIFSKKDINFFKKKIIRDLNIKLKNNLESKTKIKELKNYHNAHISEDEHKFLVNPDHRYINFTSKDLSKINKKVLSLFKQKWGHSKISLSWIGDLKKKQKKINYTGYRIARPVKKRKNKDDVAGVHIDMNIGGIINRDKESSATMWIPIIGFDKKYTLRISPKSHKNDHGKKFIKKKRISPILPTNYYNKFNFIRLNFKPGETMIFHPNLLHGGSQNTGTKTRVSLDVRILNLKRFKY
jgi:hypothetical protein